MVISQKSRLLFQLCLAAFACDVALAQARAVRPLTVSGIVLDTKGRPLEGAQVRLNADFVYGRAEITTGADGRYRITDLIKATYRAEAHVRREYAGGSICARLAMPNPSDYNSFPVSAGAERNFRWQLTGRVGVTDEYFGASIGIWGIDDKLRSSARSVEFTLTPTGPLVDGSAAVELVKEAVFRYPSSEDGVRDIPLGTYKLRAVLIGKDGSRRPLVVKALGTETFARDIDVEWRPNQICGFGSASGVGPFAVELQGK